MTLFLKNLQAIVISFALCSFLSFLLNTYSRISSTTWFYGVLFLIITSLILNLIYASKAGTKDFTQLLLGSIVIRLLLSLVVIIIYSFIDKPGFFSFSLQFVMHYILFTIFEIRYLLYILKTHPLKHN